AVGFGGLVAFSVYLPTYLKNAYQLTQADAANKMAGFVLLAVVMRPVGGWLADRLGPPPVLAGAFTVVAAGALGQSLTPALAPAGTIAFLAMAAALGAAAGAVFALVAQRAPAQQVGGVTGVVGAAGGLGGFVPPLVVGSLYGATRAYASGLIAPALLGAGRAGGGAGAPPRGPPAGRRSLPRAPDRFPPAPGGASRNRGAPRAVHDVGPGEVAERGAEHVDQPGERPHGEQHPGEQDMDLEAGRRAGDQADVGVEVEDAAEVRRDRQPVVVGVAEQVAEHGGG